MLEAVHSHTVNTLSLGLCMGEGTILLGWLVHVHIFNLFAADFAKNELLNIEHILNFG